MPPDDLPGGQGDGPPPSRSDLALFRQACRAEWPMPTKVRQSVYQKLVNLIHRTKDPRTLVMAIRTVIAADNLNVKQQLVDLARERLDMLKDGDGEFKLSDLVADAEEAARKLRETAP